MDANRIIEHFDTLSVADLRRVYVAAGARLNHHLVTHQADGIDGGEPPEPADEKQYRQEYMRCRKAGCKTCGPGGPGHAPHWYCYYTKDGQRHKRYIGKHLPPGVDIQG
jgi:hypothetical protein